MKRVWTARSLAAVLGGSLLYFLITVLVMMLSLIHISEPTRPY